MNTIKAIIFDVDGTLYHSPQLVSAMRQHWVNAISKKLNIAYKEADERRQLLEKKYGSTTEGLHQLGFGTLKEVSFQTQTSVDKAKYIKKDKRLVKMMENLSKRYQLFLLRNGLNSGTLTVLKLLGFPAKHIVFNKMFSTIDDFGVMKPDLKPFYGIISYTKLKPYQHLIVGDRVAVDLTPAKKVGMQTVLVTWGRKMEKHPDVDYYIRTIYDVENLVNGKR